MGEVIVKLDRARLTARMQRGKDIAGAALAEQILSDCKPLTPHDQGTLESSSRVEKIDGDYAVTWNEVYAAYQYYGCWPDGSHVVKNHDTSINAEATTQWAEAAHDKYGEDWNKLMQQKHVEGAKG